jgi:3-dehydroquinate synthase
MIPFMTEEIYQNIVRSVDSTAPESIHLCDFPAADETMIDTALEKSMAEVLKVVVMGRACRNLSGIKNCVGCFYPPRGVLIDPAVLDTLPPRQVAAGMAEIIKIAATFDENFFRALEQGALPIEEIIARALSLKEAVVEQDEKESGLRRVLNFGHTIGHGIEACGGLFHGECVALGMLPMCSEEVRERLLSLYTRYGLPTAFTGDVDRVIAALSHDKKLDGACLRTVYVPRVGSYEIREEQLSDFASRVREVYAS